MAARWRDSHRQPQEVCVQQIEMFMPSPPTPLPAEGGAHPARPLHASGRRWGKGMNILFAEH